MCARSCPLALAASLNLANPLFPLEIEERSVIECIDGSELPLLDRTVGEVVKPVVLVVVIVEEGLWRGDISKSRESGRETCLLAATSSLERRDGGLRLAA